MGERFLELGLEGGAAEEESPGPLHLGPDVAGGLTADAFGQRPGAGEDERVVEHQQRLRPRPRGGTCDAEPAGRERQNAPCRLLSMLLLPLLMPPLMPPPPPLLLLLMLLRLQQQLLATCCRAVRDRA